MQWAARGRVARGSSCAARSSWVTADSPLPAGPQSLLLYSEDLGLILGLSEPPSPKAV